ncbi:MAG TPA: putative lipid II flippase FtsW [Candidatus Limnocylindria bacterium]|nr:putative lipid II flippase FtsW [Candidatus Limnocylindria bacterium]
MRRPRLPTHTGYDLMLLSVVLGLLAIGLAMVYSASGIKALDALDDPRYFLIQQSAWVAIGLVAMFVVARVDYHRYRALALPGLALAVVLLAIVLVPGVGTRVGGASRWLRVSSFAGVQPAELAKLAVIVYLAFWFAAKRELVGRWAVTVPFVGLVLLVAGLVVAEPDLGTAIVLIAIALAMYFAAGARVAEFVALGGLTTISVAAVAVVQPYRLARLATFLDPWSDPQKTGFQTIQSIYGLALGGPLGEGLGAGKEKFGFLPAPYTDSIFAVLGDELGLLGTLTVVVLFLVIAFKGIRIALSAPDATGALLATGLTVWIVFQAWMNMAVVAALVPLTGITLPFISYGGSSICVGLVAVGILLNVGRQAVGTATDRPPVQGPARGRGDRRPRQPVARGRGGAHRPDERRAPVHRWTSRPRG